MSYDFVHKYKFGISSEFTNLLLSIKEIIGDKNLKTNCERKITVKINKNILLLIYQTINIY